MNVRGPSFENSSYRRRWPVLINVGGSGTGPLEATIDLPERWDHLWDNISDTTNAYDVVPTLADGTTIPTFDLTTGKASLALGIIAGDLNIRCSGLSWSGGTIDAGVMWVYWLRAAASDRSGSPTTSSPLGSNTAVIHPSPDEKVATYSPNSIPGPYRKDSDETLRIWFDVTPLLVDRVHASEKSKAGGGVDSFYFEVTNAGTADGSMKDASGHKYIVDGHGRHLIGCLVTGGTTANNYLAELHVTTTDGRVRKLVAEVTVDDRVES